MYLLIDMSQFDHIHLALFDADTRVDETYEGRNRELLFSIDTLLEREGKTKDDIKGIMVVVGSGSFTSTRIAVVVANTFAYARQIPLLAIAEDKIGSAQDLIPELMKQTPGHYISATYSGEPNIGKSKK